MGDIPSKCYEEYVDNLNKNFPEDSNNLKIYKLKKIIISRNIRKKTNLKFKKYFPLSDKVKLEKKSISDMPCYEIFNQIYEENKNVSKSNNHCVVDILFAKNRFSEASIYKDNEGNEIILLGNCFYNDFAEHFSLYKKMDKYEYKVEGYNFTPGIIIYRNKENNKILCLDSKYLKFHFKLNPMSESQNSGMFDKIYFDQEKMKNYLEIELINLKSTSSISKIKYTFYTENTKYMICNYDSEKYMFDKKLKNIRINDLNNNLSFFQTYIKLSCTNGIKSDIYNGYDYYYKINLKYESDLTNKIPTLDDLKNKLEKLEDDPIQKKNYPNVVLHLIARLFGYKVENYKLISLNDCAAEEVEGAN